VISADSESLRALAAAEAPPATPPTMTIRLGFAMMSSMNGRELHSFVIE